MARTIVGLFEEQSEALAAMNDLEQAGLDDNTSVATTFEPELPTRLVEAGIPQGDADVYAEGVKTGHSIVVVQGVADVDAEYTAEILDRHNVLDLSHLAEHHQRQSIQRTATSTTGAAAGTNLYEGQDTIVPIIEEQLTVGKRQVQAGGVRIRTSVQEKAVNTQVSLHSETVNVDRQAVERVIDPSAFDQFEEQTFELRGTDEEAVVSKAVRVVEEVRVKKDAVERTETISDTVRRTNVEVEQLSGDGRAIGETTNVGTTETRAVTAPPATTSTTTGDTGAIASVTTSDTIASNTSSTTADSTEQKGMFSRAWDALTGADDSDDSERGPRNNT